VGFVKEVGFELDDKSGESMERDELACVGRKGAEC